MDKVTVEFKCVKNCEFGLHFPACFEATLPNLKKLFELMFDSHYLESNTQAIHDTKKALDMYVWDCWMSHVCNNTNKSASRYTRALKIQNLFYDTEAKMILKGANK